MKNKRTLTIAATAFILIALAAFGLFRYLPQTVQAFNPQPDPPGFGLVGITFGQSIRVNVVNTAEPDPNIPPDPVRVVINFRNAAGNLFRNNEGQPIRRIALLPAGASTFLELNADDFPRDVTGLRLQIRPDVRIQQPNGNGLIPPDPIIPTTEVFNNATGRTQFVVNALPAVQRATQPTSN